MSVREAINRSPRVAGTAAVVIAAVAAFLILRGPSQAGGTGIATEGFFTTDDGKQWFADSLERVPPFDRNGAQAVRAYVYRCDGKAFVGYLERFSPAGVQALADLKSRNELRNSQAVAAIYEAHVQVKRPGEAEWVPLNSPQGQALLVVRCPGGSVAEVTTP
jgi:hypothetical protein